MRIEAVSGRQALFVAIISASAALLTILGIAFAMRATHASAVRSARAVPKILTGDAAQGRHLFLMNCAHCHGDDAHGEEGPDLYDLRKSDQRIRQVITGGIKGEMPAFAKKMGDPEIRLLTAYLRTLES